MQEEQQLQLLPTTIKRVDGNPKDFMIYERNKRLVCIVGNIGAGKSDLVKNIKLHYHNLKASREHLLRKNVFVKKEPVNIWRDIGLLNALYRDIKQPLETSTPYDFQQLAFSSRLVSYLDIDWETALLGIVDGHVLIDRHVFTENLVAMNSISKERLRWYEESFKQWNRLVPYSNPDLFIYLRATPQVCKDRILKRGRPEEIGIPIEYLSDLHNRFEKFTQDHQAQSIVIDVSEKDHDQVLSLVIEHLDKRISNIKDQ